MSDELNSNDVTRPMPVNVEVTHPTPSGEIAASTQPSPVSSGKPAKKAHRRGLGWLIFGGIVLILLVAALGGYLGYGSAVKARNELKASRNAVEAATQFQYALDDMASGRYQMARERLEYIINKLDPNFPGVQDKLVEVSIALIPIPTVIPTATLTPTPVFTPTPDLRGEEELFRQIQQHTTNKAWGDVINAIEALRKKNVTYRSIEADGLYYIALRNRGMDKITRGDLEGGMYDLALVERFGPLDRDADNFRMWARYYVIGASFWEVDWEKAANYFGEVAASLPMLRDASNVPAIERYRYAAGKYAEKLVAQGDYCKANKLMDGVFGNNYRNATLEPIATQAARECNPPTETATKTSPTISLTPSVTRSTPTGSTPTRTSTTSGATATPSRTHTQGAPATSTPTRTYTVAAPATSTPTVPPKPPTATYTSTKKP